MKIKSKLYAVIFVLSWFAFFLITGSMEQDIITISQGMISSAINFITLGISGVKSGLLTFKNDDF